MTLEEQQKMHFLCKQMVIEQDSKVFDKLVFELNELLEAKDRRIQDVRQKDPLAAKLK